MKVTKEMYTETAHRLDGHPGRCKNVHGHSYRWCVTLEGDHLANGMLLDFSDLKKAMTEVIDPFDHALVLQSGNEIDEDLIAVLIKHGMDARIMEVPWRPTAENMALVVSGILQGKFPDFAVTVRVYETVTSHAEVTAGR